MLSAITAFLAAFPALIGLINRAVTAWENQVAINKADAQLRWSQALQSGLQPLEQGKETTDAEKLAAVKAVADAWKNMPS